MVDVMKTMELSIEIETMSTEMIKPSTPTPLHLKSYQLSLLDQLLSFSEYSTPLVFFYTSPRLHKEDEGTHTVTRLKESLSKTLPHYYPLAGRVIPQDSIINCNDQGVPLVVARANCSLFSYLSAPNRVDLVFRFIPRDDTFLDPTRIAVDGLIPIAFQISLFNCGGFAMGSHGITKAIDGTTWAHFFMTWAAISTGGGPQLQEYGDLDLTTPTRIFPPVPNHYVQQPHGVPRVLQPVDEDGSGGCVVKAFEFSPAAISGLQARACSESIQNPTRIESVTCFLWKHLMAAAATVHSSSSIAGQEKLAMTTAAIHSVNMRAHLRPALPPTCFGKFVTHAIANLDNKERGTPITIGDLVVILRQALLKSKDSEWLNKFSGNGRDQAAYELKKTLDEFFPKSYFFTSLGGFDQVNFGSGAPVWIGFTGGRLNSYFRNYIPLIHTTGRRIEAWVILDEREMAVLESDQEFLAFASILCRSPEGLSLISCN